MSFRWYKAKGIVLNERTHEGGKVVPVSISSESLNYFEKGHKKGNIVITVEHNNKSCQNSTISHGYRLFGDHVTNATVSAP
jgi:hypothetical protein